MSEHSESRHRRLEGKSGIFALLTTLVILIGGIVELVPLFASPPAAEEGVAVQPYSPLELAGRDIYIREGCYNCHSQMVRPMRSETVRYRRTWSRSYEYAYDRPFQFGSRRIGPDLHGVGGKYPDAWHYEHMQDPRSTSAGSIMPAYGWLLTDRIDVGDVQASLGAMQSLGVPYADDTIAEAESRMRMQGQAIVDNFNAANVCVPNADGSYPEADRERCPVEWDREIVAITAYLQALGRYKPDEI